MAGRLRLPVNLLELDSLHVALRGLLVHCLKLSRKMQRLKSAYQIQQYARIGADWCVITVSISPLFQKNLPVTSYERIGGAEERLQSRSTSDSLGEA